DIGAHAFRPGENHDIRHRRRVARPDKQQFHLRMRAQRIEVGMVADARQYRDQHSQGGVARRDYLAIDGILRVQSEALQVRQHSEDGLAGVALEPAQSRIQQADVATKAIDYETGDARTFAVAEQCQGPDQVREYAATVDVGDQQHWTIDRLRETHIGGVD